LVCFGLLEERVAGSSRCFGFGFIFYRLQVAFLPLYLIWGMCGSAQNIGSIGEAGGGFRFVCFCLGSHRRVAEGGIGDGETGRISLLEKAIAIN
jgi:hypothetical protein